MPHCLSLAGTVSVYTLSCLFYLPLPELHALIHLLCIYALVKHKSVIIEALNDLYRQERLRPNILRMYAQREAVTLDAGGSEYQLVCSQSSFW